MASAMRTTSRSCSARVCSRTRTRHSRRRRRLENRRAPRVEVSGARVRRSAPSDGRMTMRSMLKLAVLGFAGLGIYRAWELAGPKVSEVRGRAEGAREKLEPAVRDAVDTVQTAAKD